ncbi:sensor histidine kinase, partial [Salmonella enterica]
MQDALAALREQLKHTIRQTNQMLALARADTPDAALQPVDLGRLAGDVTRRHWAAARSRRIDLGFEMPEPVPAVQADPGLLEEALSNLIDNALKYTPEGGCVTVRVAASDGVVVLSVADDGPGIPAEDLPRVTERFFRAGNTQGSGSGLGLAIVAAIARRHGAR